MTSIKKYEIVTNFRYELHSEYLSDIGFNSLEHYIMFIVNSKDIKTLNIQANFLCLQITQSNKDIKTDIINYLIAKIKSDLSSEREIYFAEHIYNLIEKEKPFN